MGYKWGFDWGLQVELLPELPVPFNLFAMALRHYLYGAAIADYQDSYDSKFLDSYPCTLLYVHKIASPCNRLRN